MSFFKKLTKEFEELKANLADDKKDDHKDNGNMASDQGTRGYPPLGSQQPPYQAYQGSYPPPHPSPYGNYNQGYGSQPPPPQQYGAPQYGYASPPPAPPGYANISVPTGWLAQFDPSSQRWFYIEKATGRTQWEAPPQQDHYDASRGYAPDSHSQAAGYYSGASHRDGGYGQHQYGGGNYPHANGESEKKKSDKSGMLLAAAGGLAVGAVGGALVANALDDDDEHHAAAAAPVASAPAQYGGAYGADPSMPPPVLGATDEDGHSVSSSDRESVQDARAEYEEALAEAADSDASHSEREELEEARQEYIEEYEENYGGDDD